MSAKVLIGAKVRYVGPGYMLSIAVGDEGTVTSVDKRTFDVKFDKHPAGTYYTFRHDEAHYFEDLNPQLSLPIGAGTPSYTVKRTGPGTITVTPDDVPKAWAAWSPALFDVSTYSNDDQKKKWKEEGRCQECGTLLPMSVWGLGECPNHPAPPPERQ